MSLINRMLQDLEARSDTAPEPIPASLRPARRGKRRAPQLALGALALLALLGAGMYAWRAAPSPAVPARPASRPAPDLVARQQEAAPLPVAEQPAAGAPPAAAAPVPESAEGGHAQAAGEAAPRPALAARRASAMRPPPGSAASTASTTARTAPENGAVRARNPAGQAEAAYRRALAVLAQGRVGDAIDQLDAVLQANIRHAAARETLIGLLVEAGRSNEAVRELKIALAIDARQPALAMLLARLQIDHGGDAIETLIRTLPYAAGNGDYQAFLAGALARAGRQREAAEQYEVALRTAPQNGVWWMGLGIALQAEKRHPEAAAAFQKALDSEALSAELQGFVERKLKQLNR